MIKLYHLRSGLLMPPFIISRYCIIRIYYSAQTAGMSWVKTYKHDTIIHVLLYLSFVICCHLFEQWIQIFSEHGEMNCNCSETSISKYGRSVKGHPFVALSFQYTMEPVSQSWLIADLSKEKKTFFLVTLLVVS